MSLYLTYSLSNISNFTNTRETSKGEGLQYIVKKACIPKLIPELVRQNTYTFE